jgi:type III restriction enzyme
MQLKRYQQRSLDALTAYFHLCHQLESAGMANAVGMAFTEITHRMYGQGLPYIPVNALPGLPYICLRVPTGGGKTLMACHAAGITTRELMRADRSVVLWLVPSNAIREQTLTALRSRSHPYARRSKAGWKMSLYLTPVKPCLCSPLPRAAAAS